MSELTRYLSSWNGTKSDESMLYEEGTPNGGMIFHPYEDSEIKDLVKDYRVLFCITDKKGSRIIILEK